MTRLLLFAEDFAHAAFVEPLLRRVASECNLDVQIQARTASGGRPRLITQLKQFVKDCPKLYVRAADVLVVVTDANCHGSLKWRSLVEGICRPLDSQADLRLLLLIPDPHIEKWMLVDGHAFGRVFGKGCDRPA